MASGVEGAAEFQWVDKDSADENQFQFLKEGYLNMAEVEAESEGGGKAGHGAASMLRNSDPSMKVSMYQSCHNNSLSHWCMNHGVLY